MSREARRACGDPVPCARDCVRVPTDRAVNSYRALSVSPSFSTLSVSLSPASLIHNTTMSQECHRTMSTDSLASSAAQSIQSSITTRSRLSSLEYRHSDDDLSEADDLDEDPENDEDEEEQAYDEEEDDPLGVKKLALSFDYLLYKISAKMESLAEQTELSVTNRQSTVQDQIIDVDHSIQKLKDLMKECDELDIEFIKLEQIGAIVQEFKQRIEQLEKYFRV